MDNILNGIILVVVCAIFVVGLIDSVTFIASLFPKSSSSDFDECMMRLRSGTLEQFEQLRKVCEFKEKYGPSPLGPEVNVNIAVINKSLPYWNQVYHFYYLSLPIGQFIHRLKPVVFLAVEL